MTSKKKPEIYLSLDVETDGPAPGLNNMLTFGAVAFNAEGEYIDQFYERIIPLPDLAPSPETMIWWRTQDNGAYFEAFDENLKGIIDGTAIKDRTTAFDAMLNFAAWLNYIALNVKSDRFVAMAWPAAFDFPYVNYYSHRFLRRNPLGYDCIDMRSYIMGLLRKRSYRDIKEEEINNLFGVIDRSRVQAHVAVDDAKIQGELYFHIRNSPFASEALIKSGS